jgi:hypothetical protein
VDWSATIDLYCERTDASFWSEPWNAATNLAFLVAAWLAFRQWRAAGRRDLPVLLLTGIVVLVGIGSFLFHTVATRWASLADVVPIQLFILGYFLLAMRRYFGLGVIAAVVLTAVFVAASLSLPGLLPAGFPRGSAGYLGGLVALVLVGLLLRGGLGRDASRHAIGNALVAIAAIFAVSLSLRSIDLDVCGWLPTGTHPAWHLLNAVVLYLLLLVALRAGLANSTGKGDRQPPAGYGT